MGHNRRMSPAELFSVAGKTALVTGGSRGIGRMIAEGFVEAGARVYVASRKADVCTKGHGVSRREPASASRRTSPGMKSAAAWPTKSLREETLDILVNNAAATWGTPLADFDEAAFERVLALNVKGVFHLTKFLVPLLEEAGSQEEPARVINIGSIDGIGVPTLETYSYSASKAAVHQLTRHLREAPRPHDHRERDRARAVRVQDDGRHVDAFRDQIEASAPLKRIGRPDDMAGAAIYLASRAGAYLTGAIIPVDGGIATTR